MPYIPNGPLNPEGLGELAVVLEVSLRDARERLERFRHDPTIPKAKIEQGQRFFGALLAQNERMLAMIARWAEAGRLDAATEIEAKRVAGILGQLTAVTLDILAITRLRSRDPKAELLRVPVSALPQVRADIERDIAGTARDLEQLDVAALASLPVISKGDLDDMIAGYQGVIPVLSCYPALVREWQKGKLTAGRRKELIMLKSRIDLLLRQVAMVLTAAKTFTGKLMTEEPNAVALKIAQSFVVE